MRFIRRGVGIYRTLSSEDAWYLQNKTPLLRYKRSVMWVLCTANGAFYLQGLQLGVGTGGLA